MLLWPPWAIRNTGDILTFNMHTFQFEKIHLTSHTHVQWIKYESSFYVIICFSHDCLQWIINKDLQQTTLPWFVPPCNVMLPFLPSWEEVYFHIPWIWMAWKPALAEWSCGTSKQGLKAPCHFYFHSLGTMLSFKESLSSLPEDEICRKEPRQSKQHLVWTARCRIRLCWMSSFSWVVYQRLQSYEWTQEKSAICLTKRHQIAHEQIVLSHEVRVGGWGGGWRVTVTQQKLTDPVLRMIFLYKLLSLKPFEGPESYPYTFFYSTYVGTWH
jgi:hypothetical protein